MRPFWVIAKQKKRKWDNETNLPPNEKNQTRKKKIGMAISVGFVYLFIYLFTYDLKNRPQKNKTKNKQTYKLRANLLPHLFLPSFNVVYWVTVSLYTVVGRSTVFISHYHVNEPTHYDYFYKHCAGQHERPTKCTRNIWLLLSRWSGWGWVSGV